MKLFKCQHCGQLLYFENTHCERCGHKLGFFHGTMELLTLESNDQKIFRNIVEEDRQYSYCDNAQYGVCNWLVEVGVEQALCHACRLNKTIPDLSVAGHLDAWRKLEEGKHRLVYTLLQLKLPVSVKTESSRGGLAFDFLSDNEDQEKVFTGHADGLITINLAEADEAKRVNTRKELNEPYRTILGHFRHEVGHYYWDQLIKEDEQRLSDFRGFFGDERVDYNEAIQVYYKNGAPPNWQNEFVSAYATAHSWEDWAETWAHYLHIMDTLETAYSFGLRIKPVAVSRVEMLAAEYAVDPFHVEDFQKLIELWIPLTIAINSVNRSMGQPDLYPFVVSPVVIKKLSYVHALVAEVRAKKLSAAVL